MIAPRLHVITALQSTKAIVLRRGPSSKVACILWDRNDNSFELGQWLKGCIYEHRCDLSPDGRHFVYFSTKQNQRSPETCRTVLSRTPWLRHIAQGTQLGTYYGGGAFTAKGELWLNGLREFSGNLDRLSLASPDAFPSSTDGFYMGNLFAAKMTVQGWEHVSGTGYDVVLRKRISKKWALTWSVGQSKANRSFVSPHYAFVRADGCRFEYPEIEWADLGADGLQVAQNGALFDIDEMHRDGALSMTLIKSFHDMTYQAIRAPYDPEIDAGVIR